MGGSSSQPRTNPAMSLINEFSVEELYSPLFKKTPVIGKNPLLTNLRLNKSRPHQRRRRRRPQKRTIQSDDAPRQTPWTTKKEIALAKDRLKWQEVALPKFAIESGSSKRHKSSCSSSFNTEYGEASINLNTSVGDNDKDDVQKIRRPGGRDKARSSRKNKGSKASRSSTVTEDALDRLMVTEMTTQEKEQRKKFLKIKRREVECHERELQLKSIDKNKKARGSISSHTITLIGDQRKAMDEIREKIKAKIIYEAWIVNGINVIASSIGKPLIMDKRTTRMCIEDYFSKFVDVEYSWRTRVCIMCKVFRYYDNKCGKMYIKDKLSTEEEAQGNEGNGHMKGGFVEKEKKLWKNLNEYKRIVNDNPWVLMGDWNVSFNNEDHSEEGSCKIQARCFKEIDRVMGNNSFMGTFCNSVAHFLPHLSSNHCLVVLVLPKILSKKKKDFKFANYVVDKLEFLEQAKITWMSDGDKNNKFFHVVIKGKTPKNKIDMVCDEKGDRFEGKNVAEQFVKHFQIFLGKTVQVDPLFPNSLNVTKATLKDANLMVKPVTDVEIKDAIFDICALMVIF
nr:hypothetical protein [Tanacetum cinerariifolium]